MADPSSIRIPTSWLPSGSLMVEVWLNDFLCRLLVNTGSTHIILLPEHVTTLGLRKLPVEGALEMTTGRLDQPVTLYDLPQAEVEGVFRYDLVVAELDLDWLRQVQVHGTRASTCSRPSLGCV